MTTSDAESPLPHPIATQGRARRRPDWWIYVTAALLTLQCVLYLVPQVWPGLAGLVCWTIGADRLLWLIVGGGLLIIALAWSLWRWTLGRSPLVTRWRLVGVAAIFVLMLSSLIFQSYPSSYANRPSDVRFRLPLDGPILVGWGGDTADVNYHVIAPDQRWAYDLLVAQEGRTHRGDGSALEDYYCYGLPVLAPADGVVVALLDGQPDQPVGVLGGLPPGGNQIVIEVAPGEYLFLCHLKRGSIAVKEGDRVAAGQPLAKVGNSGNTSEPHLHIHLQNTPEMHLGEGIPLYFHNYRVGNTLVERGMPTGGFANGQFSGQIVEHAGPEAE